MADKEKKVSKIVFAGEGIEIFAISMILPEKMVLSDGKTVYNFMLNGDVVGDVSIIGALKNENGIPVQLKRNAERFSGEKEKLLQYAAPQNEQGEVMDLYFWSGFENIIPYSYKITKEVGE